MTEKIDGTCAHVLITEDGRIIAGSRTRWITPTNDNMGFAKWVEEHKEELLKLGPGQHFGEWWGQKIGRTYGLTEKRFWLFNVSRWGDAATRPACCGVVPILYQGEMSQYEIEKVMQRLIDEGSVAVPGYNKPEGIVIFHVAGNLMFKKTVEKDEQWKGATASQKEAE